MHRTCLFAVFVSALCAAQVTGGIGGATAGGSQRIAAVAGQKTPTKGTASVAGVVLAKDSGRPLRKVAVVLLPETRWSWRSQRASAASSAVSIAIAPPIRREISCFAV